jgi:hypothetical protein
MTTTTRPALTFAADRSRSVEELIIAYRGLTAFVARRFFRAGHAEPAVVEDAVSEAMICLCEAAPKWDRTRGYSFGAYLVPAVERRIRLLRRKNLKYWEHETRALGADLFDGPGDEGSDDEEGVSGRDRKAAQLDAAAQHLSPEDLLLEAEERAAGAVRLAKLSGASRAKVEAILEDRPQRRLGWKSIAREAGVRVAKSNEPAAELLSGAERQARSYARNRAAILERLRARRQAAKAAVAA